MHNSDERNNHDHSRGGNIYLTYLIKVFVILSDDPRVKILKLLAESSTGDLYVSFRTIARRIGINYTKLRHYLSQLEVAGFIEHTRINIIASNSNNKNNNKGYTYYRLKREVRDIIRDVLNSKSASLYYPYLFFLALASITIYI